MLRKLLGLSLFVIGAVLIPAQVAVEDLEDFLSVCDRMKNLDGIIVTVPHKFSCFKHCTDATPRGKFLGAVNIMRRLPQGGWFGEMVDGQGFVGAIRNKGFDPSGKRALQIGAGGAGSAIALSLIDSGVRELALHDEDANRRDNLIVRLNGLGKGRVIVGSPDPTGFDLIANATPAGMKPTDPYPVDVTKFTPAMFVGCVITQPAASPMVEAARKAGCNTSTGTDMYHALQSAMVDFLLFADAGDKQ